MLVFARNAVLKWWAWWKHSFEYLLLVPPPCPSAFKSRAAIYNRKQSDINNNSKQRSLTRIMPQLPYPISRKYSLKMINWENKYKDINTIIFINRSTGKILILNIKKIKKKRNKLNRKPFDSVCETSGWNINSLKGPPFACNLLHNYLMFTRIPSNISFSATFQVEKAQGQPANQNTGRVLRNCWPCRFPLVEISRVVIILSLWV